MAIAETFPVFTFIFSLHQLLAALLVILVLVALFSPQKEAKPFRWQRSLGLGKIPVGFVIITLTLMGAVISVLLWRTTYVFWGTLGTPPEDHDIALRNLGIGLAAVVGLPLVIWRSLVAQKTVQVAESSAVTEQIQKAVENLNASKEDGTPLLHTRIAGLYALDRIARDNLDRHIEIMKIICAYVRTEFPRREGDEQEKNPTAREDLQEAMTVLGKRSDEGKKLEARVRYRLNLFSTNISGTFLASLDFSNAIFSKSTLNNVHFFECDMTKALLRKISTRETAIVDCLLKQTDVSRSHLENTRILFGDIHEATTDIRDTNLESCRVAYIKSKKDFEIEDFALFFMGNKLTVLPKNIQKPQCWNE